MALLNSDLGPRFSYARENSALERFADYNCQVRLPRRVRAFPHCPSSQLLSPLLTGWCTNSCPSFH